MGNTVIQPVQNEANFHEIESTNALERAKGDRGIENQGSFDKRGESDGLAFSFDEDEDED